jgi:hypothetical protein
VRGLVIERPNQVWCADITYIPTGSGFLYVVAVVDWASRVVLSWRLSNTMDVSLCISTLLEALFRLGKPENPGTARPPRNRYVELMRRRETNAGYQTYPISKPGCVQMIEAVTAILGLFSAGIFAAHAVDNSSRAGLVRK